MTRPNGFRRSVQGVACLLVLHAAIAGRVAAQSLADVSRREVERRTQTAPGRAYTNSDLSPAPPPSRPTPAPAAPVTSNEVGKAESGSGAPGDTKPTADAGSSAKPKEKRDEVYWRARVGDLQGRIARLNADISALEARGRKSGETGATSPAAKAEQAAAETALAKLRQDLTWMNAELDGVYEQARAAKVPDSWLGL